VERLPRPPVVSTGKDALTAALALFEHHEEVVPFYVPHLGPLVCRGEPKLLQAQPVSPAGS
jgi:hypothetical protein